MLRAICSWVLASSSAAFALARLACAFGTAAFAVATRSFGLFYVRLRRRQLRLDLVHRVLIRRRVNLQQQVTFLHGLICLGVDRLDLPFHVGDELNHVLARHHLVRDRRRLRPDHHDAADHEHAGDDHGRDQIGRGLDVQDLEQHENDGNVNNDQKCDHGRVSLSPGGLRNAVTRVAAPSDSAAPSDCRSSLPWILHRKAS